MTMTPEELQAAIAANTQTINFLVTQFIRPSAQQHQQSIERLEHIEGLLERHAEVITAIDMRLEEIAQQQQTNAQQIAQNTEAITRFDGRLEETRALVAENSSRIAQIGTKQDQLLDRIDVQQKRTTENINRLSGEVQAIAEASRTQLAGIISNGRRIDRLEQQAS